MSIRIPFGELVITSDKDGYQLNKVKVHPPGHKTNPGETYLAPFRYWTTVTALFRGLCEHAVRNSDATTLEELKPLLAAHTRLVAEIRAVLDGEVE